MKIQQSSPTSNPCQTICFDITEVEELIEKSPTNNNKTALKLLNQALNFITFTNLQEIVYSNVRLLKDNIVVADTGSITLSIKNPTRTLVKKGQQMPLYFDSKDNKIENNFTMTAVNLLADFEDLEGNFTLEVYNEEALAMKFNEVTLTTVNEVKGIVEGYARLSLIRLLNTTMSWTY
jgi:hypothetical protein